MSLDPIVLTLKGCPLPKLFQLFALHSLAWMVRTYVLCMLHQEQPDTEGSVQTLPDRGTHYAAGVSDMAPSNHRLAGYSVSCSSHFCSVCKQVSSTFSHGKAETLHRPLPTTFVLVLAAEHATKSAADLRPQTC